MLTWINENAKWVIAIFAVGIALGLLAMDRTPEQTHQYPIGRVDGAEIPYAEFNNRVNNIMETNYRGQNLSDEQRAQLRNSVFQAFVQQELLKFQFEENGLYASVAEMKAELKNNPDVVRRLVGEEAQQRIYAIQANASNEQEAMQNVQSFIQTLPKFLLDTAFDKAAYDAWLETPAAYEWLNMQNYEQELKTMTVPLHQLQIFVTANAHPTSLESQWNVNNRMISQDLEVAFVSADDFKVDPASVDSLKVNAYFNAHQDSFFVTKDEVRLAYAYLPIQPTAKDEEEIRKYAMTVYYQVKDSNSASSFEEMAKVSSEDVGTAANGGLLGDYTARGTWVKEFEDVAFALDSGEISEPVRTKFGYHIIQSLGKIKDSTGAEKVKAAHILFSVTASPETIDSLEKILVGIKTAVEEHDSSFIDAASARKVPVRETAWLGHNDEIQEVGFVGGLSAFAFVNKDRPDLSEGKVSGALKNNNFVIVATRLETLEAGKRNIGPYYAQIQNNLLLQESKEAAAHYLNSVAEKVKAVELVTDSATGAAKADSSIEKVTVEKVTASFDGFVPGVGYSNPTLFRILSKQKVGEWGEAVVTNDGAAMVKILNRTLPDTTAAKNALTEDLANTWRFGYSMLFNEYVQNLEKAANVESNLDLYYRE
ncbi:MAG: peptidylprolyl isomerase [Hallerella sp.]|nr:peptidylprolyl isomerase [Hallerella sp.]